MKKNRYQGCQNTLDKSVTSYWIHLDESWLPNQWCRTKSENRVQSMWTRHQTGRPPGFHCCWVPPKPCLSALLPLPPVSPGNIYSPVICRDILLSHWYAWSHSLLQPLGWHGLPEQMTELDELHSESEYVSCLGAEKPSDNSTKPLGWKNPYLVAASYSLVIMFGDVSTRTGRWGSVDLQALHTERGLKKDRVRPWGGKSGLRAHDRKVENLQCESKVVVGTEIEHDASTAEQSMFVIQTQAWEYGLSHFPSYLLKLISAHPIIMVVLRL